MGVDHYNTLGVMATASAADLRTAYLKLARANHPDKFEGQDRDRAEAKMQAINEAWNVLGVTHKRSEYDATLPDDHKARSATATSSKRRGRTHFKPFDDDPVNRADIDLDPTPIAGSKDMPRWAVFLPIVLVIGGVLTMAFGTMVNGAGVFALGIICLAMGAVCFLMLPLFVMSRAERDPNL